MIPKSIPKKLREKILYWDDERDIGNGIIVTVKGITLDPMSPTHVFGEDTVAEIKSTLESCYPCDCQECQ